jgi:hypothetical protein
LNDRLNKYFEESSNNISEFQWVASPFSINVETICSSSFDNLIAGQPFDISTDVNFKLLLPFASTWSCEAAFSAVTVGK